MRRTQDAASYLALLTSLLVGVALMVGFLTSDGFTTVVYSFIFGLAAQNLALLGGIGSLLVLCTLYGLLRWQNTV